MKVKSSGGWCLVWEGLHPRPGEDGLDRVGEALEAVDAGDQHVAGAAAVEVVEDREPELGALTGFMCQSGIRSPKWILRAARATPSSPAPQDSHRSPISSGKTNRHRLDRGGNRQINAAIHRVAVTRARCDPETQTYITRATARSSGLPVRLTSAALRRPRA